MPPGLATCFGNSGLAAVTSISWGQNPNMGAIGDQWVRKWGWFISFLGGRGGWRCRHFPTVNVNFVQFFIVCFHLKTGPLSSKWKSFAKWQVETKGELWLIDLGLEVWLLFWFARCSLQGLRMICVPWNVRLLWGRSPNCLWGICRVCLRKATWSGIDFLGFWVIVESSSSLDVGQSCSSPLLPHLPPHPSLALFILHTFLGSKGVLDFSAWALSVILWYSQTDTLFLRYYLEKRRFNYWSKLHLLQLCLKVWILFKMC